MRRVSVAALGPLLLLACTRTQPGGAPEPDGAPGLARAMPDGQRAAAQAAGAFDEQAPLGDWVELVRMHRYADAAKSMDALSTEEKARPEVRYVRAVVAAKLSDHARAVRELKDIDLKLLAPEVEELRAASALEAGPYELAALHFGQKPDAASLTKSATAFERAKQLDKARAAADRAVVAAGRQKKGNSREADARAVRARIAEAKGDTATAVADLRWLAVHAPTSASAEGVDQRLEKLAPLRALSKKERYARALALADVGAVDRVDQELAALDRAPGNKLKAADALHARGWALYIARRDYAKAAELLEQASKAGGEHAVKDLFYAARSRSRAHQDDQAIVMYERLARQFSRSGYAEQARFLAARLRYIGGKWGEAAAAYDRYLARHKKRGRFLDSATYERAVAWLASGQNARAAKAFKSLADGTDHQRKDARYEELHGVALAAAGNKKAAAAAFREVIADHPLSFPALAAAARLKQMGEIAPPPIEPADSAKVRGLDSVSLPEKARLLQRVGLDTQAEDELARHEDSIRKKYAPRGDEALCRAYGTLSSASRRYRVGQRAAKWSALKQAPGSANRWLWDCIYPRPYEALVRDAEKNFQLPQDFVYAIMRQESAFSPGVVSSANAVGLMQLIPPTAANVAKELKMTYDPLQLYSPAVNIKMGAYYLSKVLSTFGGNVALAAAAYNAGPSAVSRWLESGEGLPLDVWVARIPYSETRGYVTRVVGNIARYAYLEGGQVPHLDLALPLGLRAGDDAY
ncbi:MAG TPA: transglycosylase SLT domain-containing protein [Polyangiaceae bacterium]|nr:transglycosylase SLT domain-containing protein [Polyangiaceae bacterium]